MKKKIKKIAILTGGGDCPGLNAVIGSVTRSAINDYGWEVWGIEDGFAGLVEGHMHPLTIDHVSGIFSQGGTILGTTNKANPFLYPVQKNGKLEFRDASHRALRLFKEGEFDALVCVGGDGTISYAKRFAKEGLPVVAIPKTIDNDVPGTERTVGFYSAVHTATEAIDKLRTTAASHHRVMVVEVMGRNAGWLALASGLAGGGHVILIPEMPFDLKKIYEKVLQRSSKGARFTIIIAGEGSHPADGKKVFQRKAVGDVSHPERLGGISYWLAENIEKNTGIESRAVVLGHVLRGGSPVYQDRILATCFGCEATHRLAMGEKGMMVGWGKGEHISIPLKKLAGGVRHVPKNHQWIDVLRSMGAIFAEAE
ncbi:MAG: ATP-dependent 6-phosphofructokinase [Deltaproteobacteria bacterium]|nr:ATP-dependent 6-phosphofructokinase [Deltaproteobacteria bacterium]